MNLGISPNAAIDLAKVTHIVATNNVDSFSYTDQCYNTYKSTIWLNARLDSCIMSEKTVIEIYKKLVRLDGVSGIEEDLMYPHAFTTITFPRIATIMHPFLLCHTDREKNEVAIVAPDHICHIRKMKMPMNMIPGTDPKISDIPNTQILFNRGCLYVQEDFNTLKNILGLV